MNMARASGTCCGSFFFAKHPPSRMPGDVSSSAIARVDTHSDIKSGATDHVFSSPDCSEPGTDIDPDRPPLDLRQAFPKSFFLADFRSTRLSFSLSPTTRLRDTYIPTMSDLKFRGYAIKDEKNWTQFELLDFECVSRIPVRLGWSPLFLEADTYASNRPMAWRDDLIDIEVQYCGVRQLLCLFLTTLPLPHWDSPSLRQLRDIGLSD
jgi:hypothetical protein